MAWVKQIPRLVTPSANPLVVEIYFGFRLFICQFHRLHHWDIALFFCWPTHKKQEIPTHTYFSPKRDLFCNLSTITLMWNAYLKSLRLFLVFSLPDLTCFVIVIRHLPSVIRIQNDSLYHYILVTDRPCHWRGVPTDWKWWFFVTHRLLYLGGDPADWKWWFLWHTDFITHGGPNWSLDFYIVTDPWWEVVSRGLRQEMTQKHKT